MPKGEVTVAGTALLDRILATLPTGVPVVVCGPNCETSREVTFCRETPVHGGPLAGLAAAVPFVRDDVVVVLAVDMPDAGELAPLLAQACAATSADGVVPVDRTGRRQPLAAGYRTSALVRGLAAVGRPDGRAMGSLLDVLDLETMVEPVVAGLLDDIDTRDDLQQARARRKGSGGMLQDWVQAVRDELGLDGEVDVDGLLDVARVAAHNVERPAAPLTMYLMGLAVGSGRDAATVTASVQALAERWSND